jgi:glutathione synthase/RimK-type ligase-like ATP-grasp enzyme
VFNNAKTAAVACDKWETYQSCKAWGIPVLRTVKQGEKMQYPCVMKSRNGHGGEEVFWVETEEETQKILEKQGGGKEYILQAPNEILGKDMRVYAIGGKIVASVLRSSACDFRSNFSLGGKVEKAQADGWQEQVVNTLYQKLKFDYIGVDFLPTATGWVLNEIEDSAGARMLYSCTDIDIVKLYAAHILCEIL